VCRSEANPSAAYRKARPIAALAAACLCACAALAAEPRDPDRGRLLYEVQCFACHSNQAHWRNKRVVQSWRQLIDEVGRWERSAGQSWSEEDIHDVAAYLNGLYYRLPCPTPGCEGTRAARDGAPHGS